MNNREAITLLRNLEDSLDSYCELNEEGKTAFRMAIEALNCSEFPNSSDTISRQAAIEIVDRYDKSHMILKGKPMLGAASIVIELEDLPSAQPEIIRCKDCKHFHYDMPYVIQGIPVLGHEVCDFWGDGCKTSENGFCSFAEE